MPSETALNSHIPLSGHTLDDDDLKMLKLQDTDLDRFATYFELAFQGDSRSITVLVGLLQRLSGVEKLRTQKQSGIWVEDIVGRLTHRLYSRCEPGLAAASRFGNEASDLAELIFAEGLVVPNEL